ncbi:MAG: sigma 54-interacting transcriptional regulator, partial [Desulfohalobiaceae bacterium]|nr:sigma 54-interacting transcriptional regulator [Desulfohalobiaceae bacterium]
MDLNAYWKTVVDTIQEGVMLVDTAGTIISVNQAMQDLTGYTREELMGSSCRILNCDLCIRFQQQKQHWCRLFFEGSFHIQQCHIQQKKGRQLTVVKNGAVLRDSSNEVIGAVETLTDISELLDKEQQIESYKRVLAADDTFHGLVGGSRIMRSQFDLLTNAAHSDAPVILFGESGTGKELAARAIHDISERRKKPLIKVNCAALSHSLLESELFGHVKGAFTGATSSRKGRFEAADKGSIFLDEIGDLALSTQVKLLRVLEEQIIERVGDNRPITVDVRIISATNKNLEEMVESGAFREDLFFRIRVIPVHLPPLRERTD